MRKSTKANGKYTGEIELRRQCLSLISFHVKFTYISGTNSEVERLSERLELACVLIHVTNDFFKVLYC